MALLDLVSRLKVTQLVAPQSVTELPESTILDGGVFDVPDEPEALILDGGLFSIFDDSEAVVYNFGFFLSWLVGQAVNISGYASSVLVFLFSIIDPPPRLELKVEESDNGVNHWQVVSDSRLNGTLQISDETDNCVIGLTDVNGLTKAFVRPVIFFNETIDGLAVHAVQSNFTTNESIYI
jgi:hypothetical protein